MVALSRGWPELWSVFTHTVGHTWTVTCPCNQACPDNDLLSKLTIQEKDTDAFSS